MGEPHSTSMRSICMLWFHSFSYQTCDCFRQYNGYRGKHTQHGKYSIIFLFHCNTIDSVYRVVYHTMLYRRDNIRGKMLLWLWNKIHPKTQESCEGILWVIWEQNDCDISRMRGNASLVTYYFCDFSSTCLVTSDTHHMRSQMKPDARIEHFEWNF